MTSAVQLNSALSMQKKLVKSASVFLRRDQGVLRLASASPSGMVVRTTIPSTGEEISGMADVESLLSFARGAGDVQMESRDGRLFVKSKGVRGDIPLLSEQPPRVPRIESSSEIHAADVRWLSTNLPRIAVPDLNKSGVLSARCDGATWSMSCNDDVHGACAYGRGRSKITFSLVPADAEVLQLLLRDARGVQMGFADNLLVIKTESHQAAVPVVEGTPHAKESVVGGTRVAATVDCASIRDGLAAVQAVATAKDAAPLTIKLTEERLLLRASSPAGGIESAARASCPVPLEFRVSHPLLSALMSRADTERADLLITTESREVTRIAVRCDDLLLVMLTST